MSKTKLSISVDAELVERLDRKAKRLGLNRSQLIERFCHEAMQAALPGRMGPDARGEHLLLFRGHSERLDLAIGALTYHMKTEAEEEEPSSQPGWVELRVLLEDKGNQTFTGYQERPL